jgi:hypothetical protein
MLTLANQEFTVTLVQNYVKKGACISNCRWDVINLEILARSITTLHIFQRQISVWIERLLNSIEVVMCMTKLELNIAILNVHHV